MEKHLEHLNIMRVRNQTWILVHYNYTPILNIWTYENSSSLQLYSNTEDMNIWVANRRISTQKEDRQKTSNTWIFETFQTSTKSKLYWSWKVYNPHKVFPKKFWTLCISFSYITYQNVQNFKIHNIWESNHKILQ